MISLCQRGALPSGETQSRALAPLSLGLQQPLARVQFAISLPSYFNHVFISPSDSPLSRFLKGVCISPISALKSEHFLCTY